MQLVNAIVATRMVIWNVGQALGREGGIQFGSPWWFVCARILCFLVLFTGIMFGLIPRLMSLSLVDLKILQRSGTSAKKKQAGEAQPHARRHSAALSPEDLTDAEWYYLVCMSFVFNIGQRLLGRTLANA